ncbi:uncharacterized protein LOC100833744 isoform X2 [Brachypodium distachyon]|uniref:uncharacterized protein LOC100833744 isoform X2 n=2 Tax=Brachypodium distachyon TaxID=15368 RepID=UPI0005300B4F|nr:uncharacterized protein LOC100833744 isoform X2 [Brachypodium distachyon]|eukprot:XP_024313294.1 uncharacterized protein LOC100833744 isoform X2 [Brachypodium distachyon]
MAPNDVVDAAEHRVPMPPAYPHAGHIGAAAPEGRLNRFVRFVALTERVGNALGTLAFTWATVVLLGGYASDLGKDDPNDRGSQYDFWYATAIVLLEALRMFTRNNRVDYQLFFNTRGAFRPVGWNGLIATLCFFDVFMIVLKKSYVSDIGLVLMAIVLATGRFLSGLKLNICNPLRRATSLWSPLVAILLMAPPLSDRSHRYIYSDDPYPNKIDPWTRWIVFTALLVPVLLVTASRLRFTRINKLVNSALDRKQAFWRRVIINLCMIAALGMQVFMIRLDPSLDFPVIIITQVCALAVVSFGNFQIPAAVVRVVLALLRLEPLKDNKSYDGNLVASLRIFYGMVLGQGLLYVVACALEFFSFIPMRSLVRRGRFRGQWGVESVNLYYAYAFDKCMQEGVLAPKKISLSTFAMDSVNSGASKNQLYGIRMMNSFLQREPTKAKLLSKLTNSTKTMARIIRMLDWTSPKDATVRLYAAKVTCELAKNLRVATFPGTMQLVSALLDTDSRQRGNKFLDTDDEQEKQDMFPNIEDSREEERAEVRDVADNQLQRQELRDNDNLVQTLTSATQPVGINKQNSCMLRCWQKISGFWSTPEEQLLTDHDFLPALAMSIIDSLAGCDQDNCVEISKAADLIPKVIGFTSNRSDMTNTEAQQKVLLKSSLKVLQRLTRIDGEIGITLRCKISKHPCILRNLADILGDNRRSQELRKLVAGILRNLAVDGNTRQEIGRIQLIITRLMQAFFHAEGTMSTNADSLLRKVAGQALTMPTTDSVHNCFVMLKEPELVKNLKTTILNHDDRYIYMAASLLRNLCLHARPKLRESDLKELSHTWREVLQRTMNAEGAELEILIGLSSQICKVIPEDFIRELDDGQIMQRFVKRLVDALNANTNLSAHCPGIRRVILEQAIYMVECNSHCADYFNKCRMTEALLMVEQTLSTAENYRLFLGDVGFMEYSLPLSALVARAKELMGCEF